MGTTAGRGTTPVADLVGTIHRDFSFDPTATDVATPLSAVIENRRGVCQDFAHLLVGADASHAWCSVWVPGAGWLDLDPTNATVAPEHHVRLAWGRDYGDVAPVRGVTLGPPATQSLEVSVDVSRIGTAGSQ